MNGRFYPKGCPGAVYIDNNPSATYCGGFNSAKTKIAYPWWKKCCKWNGSLCIPKEKGKTMNIYILLSIVAYILLFKLISSM